MALHVLCFIYILLCTIQHRFSVPLLLLPLSTARILTQKKLNVLLYFNHFFDMLNTRSLEEGILWRKPDLAPYHNPEDSRLKVISTSKCKNHIPRQLVLHNCDLSTLLCLLHVWQWLEKDSLGYFNEWDKSVQSHEGFTDAERRKMCLSAETLEGLRITGFSLICHDTITNIY